MSCDEGHRRPRARDGRRQVQRNYDRLAPVYDLLEAPFERRARQTGRRLLAVARGERVLEIGCGTGADLVALATTSGPTGRCVGLDLSAGMVQRTRRRLDRQGAADSAAVVQADALRLPLAPRRFDVVYLSFTLELFAIDDSAAVLHECRRVLAPTGRIGVVSLATSEDPPLMTRLYARAHRRLPALLDCRPIDAAGLLHRAGFTVLAWERLAVWGLDVDAIVATPDPTPN